MKKHSTLFIGLDTHKDSIAVAYAIRKMVRPGFHGPCGIRCKEPYFEFQDPFLGIHVV